MAAAPVVTHVVALLDRSKALVELPVGPTLPLVLAGAQATSLPDDGTYVLCAHDTNLGVGPGRHVSFVVRETPEPVALIVPGRIGEMVFELAPPRPRYLRGPEPMRSDQLFAVRDHLLACRPLDDDEDLAALLARADADARALGVLRGLPRAVRAAAKDGSAGAQPVDESAEHAVAREPRRSRPRPPSPRPTHGTPGVPRLPDAPITLAVSADESFGVHALLEVRPAGADDDDSEAVARARFALPQPDVVVDAALTIWRAKHPLVGPRPASWSSRDEPLVLGAPLPRAVLPGDVVEVRWFGAPPTAPRDRGYAILVLTLASGAAYLAGMRWDGTSEDWEHPLVR